jgi:hypothetical protein
MNEKNKNASNAPPENGVDAEKALDDLLSQVQKEDTPKIILRAAKELENAIKQKRAQNKID